VSNLKYTPEKLDNAEFHRIREWHNTFNAALTGLLVRLPVTTGEEARYQAAQIADAQHGSISKTEPNGIGTSRQFWAY
jgi:hypothetical protein